MEFCCPHKTVRDFEKNVAVVDGTDIEINENSFIQYIADNVDHNICTLDGHGTFHGMGIIATSMPISKSTKVIPRIQVSMSDISKVAGINIKYRKDPMISDFIKYNIPESFNFDFKNMNLDLIWRSSILLKQRTHMWTGTMQMIHQGEHPGKVLKGVFDIFYHIHLTTGF